jgi:hypothetical protein
MGDVPDKTGHEMMVRVREGSLLTERAFRYQKAASKSLHQADSRDLDQKINRLRWSDPRIKPDPLADQPTDIPPESSFGQQPALRYHTLILTDESVIGGATKWPHRE